MKLKIILLLISVLLLISCSEKAINNPHPMNQPNDNTYYSSFSEQPKTLDPARSYSAEETIFLGQVYEPPLQYDYLKRPYQLIPLTANAMPKISYFDNQGRELSDNVPTKLVAYTVYQITIQPHIYYQPHPAFAKANSGKLLYDNLTAADVRNITSPNDFKIKGSRELTAADYVYEIKRLANPKVQSPIFGLMSEYILGLKELNRLLMMNESGNYINLNKFNLVGAKVINRYTYQIIIKGRYPQFIYWLAMPFFSAMPWEADKFYSQTVLQNKNIGLDTYPIGTGAYMLIENNPNRNMILIKNPNFHLEHYPGTNEKLPFIDRYDFSLEKESIPRWAKFLQGYYDASGISSDNFDSVITLDNQGKPHLSKAMQQKHFKLTQSVTPAIMYIGFNMLDPVIGGYSEQHKKLRQAISILLNEEEYVAIFLNGQGLVAQGPIPPGVFGFQKGKVGLDYYVYNWINGEAKRKSVKEAKKLLVEAGYPNGIDPKTGNPLVLSFDSPVEQGPDTSATFEWLRKQFAKAGIELDIRATEYNRFQEKIRTGSEQIFVLGWQADYPDPENFLFLLYGPNGKVKFSGENVTNYENPEFDRLFLQMKQLPNGPERQALINKMIHIVQQDAPWVWGFYPKNLALSQSWVHNVVPNAVANNTLKYLKLDPKLRAKMQSQWNHPIYWPLLIILLILLLILLPVVLEYWYRQHKKIRKEK